MGRGSSFFGAQTLALDAGTGALDAQTLALDAETAALDAGSDALDAQTLALDAIQLNFNTEEYEYGYCGGFLWLYG